MSEKLCALRKKGGKGTEYTETSLWTNQSPSSAYNGGDVTLSQSMDNFKYLMFKVKVSTTIDKVVSCIASVEEVKQSATGAGNYQITVNSSPTAAAYYSRSVIYSNSTTLTFRVAYQINASSSSTTACIPLEILGLNELDTGKRFDETTLWTNSAPTSAFAAQQVTLSQDIDNFDYIKFVYRHSTSIAVENEVLITPANLKKSLYDLGTNRVEVGLNSMGASYCENRRASYVNDTTVSFTAAYHSGASGNTTSYSIPTSIVGCKFA